MNLRYLFTLTVTLFQSSAIWLGAMGFHLWRVATFRPYYIGIADTRFSVGSFFAVFAAAASLRWYGFGEAGLEGTVSNLLQSIGLIMLISVRRNQSDALFCALMASSAIVDTMVCISVLSGFINEPRGAIFLAWELTLYASSLVAFKRQTAAIRQAGYKRELQ